ncbi:hypothetical protein OUZ56_030484 [Daphnia magna]|uniref:Uncharacterized protein n=1 Tax=Daphnia magna TaxID=35525 RepID=A0ABQ9ZRG9_9CRUS|nr:hypothetical protein OUZ56_030484 [Daphnia magna]
MSEKIGLKTDHDDYRQGSANQPRRSSILKEKKRKKEIAQHQKGEERRPTETWHNTRKRKIIIITVFLGGGWGGGENYLKLVGNKTASINAPCGRTPKTSLLECITKKKKKREHVPCVSFCFSVSAILNEFRHVLRVFLFVEGLGLCEKCGSGLQVDELYEIDSSPGAWREAETPTTR